MKGNYESSAGGWTQNPLRVFTGAPVYEYWTRYETLMSDQLWTKFKAADDLNYLLGAGTDGVDTGYNTCGIVAGHAYSMMSVFELKTGSTVDHKMYMIRDPMGNTSYTSGWNHQDSAWTADYKSQVPFGVDPTTSNTLGIFFVESTDFMSCFEDYHIAHMRDSEGYSGEWYD